MSFKVISSLSRIFFDQANLWRLLFLSVLGYAFSLAVILCTIGIMDGFESSLKQGLKLASGDAILTHKEGFFSFTDEDLDEFQFHGVKSIAGLVQSEAFAVAKSQSQGVLVRGIDSQEFLDVTGLEINFQDNSIVVGETLAQDWNLAIGDAFTLVFARGSQADMPELLNLKVSGFIKHGIHEKDQRLVYVERSFLQTTLKLKNKFNIGLIRLQDESIDQLEQRVENLSDSMRSPWIIKPSWQEFSGLLEAVAVEKKSIAIVLQLIVIVAVFNIAAFLITLRARKIREFFLLRALGMPQREFFSFGLYLMSLLWALSCLGSIILVKFFNWLLQNASIFNIPGDIYVLTKLKILLSFSDYALVFGLALLWMLILGFMAIRKIQKQSLVTGLRQEFQ